MKKHHNIEIQPKDNDINLSAELYESYSKYAAFVVLNRSIPRFEDGLLPVHRRIMYYMLSANLYDRFVKSNSIVGEVLGRYHPHGDASLYGTLVKLAQPFNNNCRLILEQGNFGSIHNDPAAGSRYTEVKLSKLAKLCFEDLEYADVEEILNYNGTELIPVYLPSRIPLFLVNGIMGIAVGASTKIPPHNLSEVMDACIALIKNSEADPLDYIKGPDFPPGYESVIFNQQDFRQIYQAGRGSFKLYGQYTIVNDNLIRITSLPITTTKEKFNSELGHLHKENEIEILDYKDKSQERVLIEISVKNPKLFIYKLLTKTSFKGFYPININLLIDQKIKSFGLQKSLQVFINQRFATLISVNQTKIKNSTRQIGFLLTTFFIQIGEINSQIIDYVKKDKIKELVELVYKNSSQIETNLELQDTESVIFKELFSKTLKTKQWAEKCTNSILDTPIKKLKASEFIKTKNKITDLIKTISNYREIIGSRERQEEILINQCKEIKQLAGKERTTVICNKKIEEEEEDPVEVIRILTSKGNFSNYQKDSLILRNRGGIGRDSGVKGDRIISATQCWSSDKIGFLTNSNQLLIEKKNINSTYFNVINSLIVKDKNDLYIKKLVHIPKNSNSVLVIFNNGKGFTISMDNFMPKRYKSTLLTLNDTSPVSCIIAYNSNITNKVLVSNREKVVYIDIKSIKKVKNRKSVGVYIIKNPLKDRIIASIIDKTSSYSYFVSETGFIKKINIDSFKEQKRGGAGVKITSKNYKIISIKTFKDDDPEEMVILNSEGKISRIQLQIKSLKAKAGKGVKAMHIADSTKILDVL